MNYLMFAIFVIATVFHLYASLKKNKKLRNISKPFILLSLLGIYIYTAGVNQWFVILALLFSWFGDLFLILDGVKWFAIGGVSFMVSHAFFALSYNEYISFDKIDTLYLISIPAVFFVLAVIIISKLKTSLPEKLIFPMFLYFLFNGAMNCFALFRYLCVANISALITVIGALLFFVSDTALFFVRFKKDGKLKTHFVVMLTYSIGELLIVLGLL